MQLTDNLYWYALGSYEAGEKVKGWGVYAGIRYAFGGSDSTSSYKKAQPKKKKVQNKAKKSKIKPVKQTKNKTVKTAKKKKVKIDKSLYKDAYSKPKKVKKTKTKTTTPKRKISLLEEIELRSRKELLR